MTNLEPIVRKLIGSGLYRYQDNHRITYWHLWYDEESLKKEYFEDESLDQVIDWFYYNVLQLEMKDEEA